MSKNKIIREPIRISKNSVMLVHMFKRYDHLEDVWMFDNAEYSEEDYEQHERAAVQLMDQLEGCWTAKFLKALRGEIDKRLKKEIETKYGEDENENQPEKTD